MMEQLISGKESLICNICQKKFDRKRDLKQHYIHHDVLTCDVCEKVFDHPKNLQKHYRIHNSKKPYRTGKKKIAGNASKTQSYSKDQLKKCTATVKEIYDRNKESFNCSVCLKIFSRLDQLKEHLSCHKTPRPFVCNVCPRQFTYKQALVKHYQTHVLKCDMCMKEFFNKRQLNHHISIHHGKTLTKVSSQKKLSDVKSLKIRNQICEKEGAYECKECKRKYDYRKNFQRHLLIHEEKRFACDVCDRSYFRKDHLQRHYRIHTGRKSYKCKKCSKAFYNLTSLRQHTSSHTKGYVSKKSGGGLDSKGDFKNNYASIENSPFPYVALEKLKIYDTKKSYLIPKEKSNVCDVCNKTFTRHWDMKRHRSRFHNKEELRRCNKCHTEFSSVASINTHKCNNLLEKVSVSKECEENLDSERDVKNFLLNLTPVNSSIESDTSLGKLCKSKYPDIKTKKKSYACKKSKKKYNYKHILQKYFRMHIVGKSFTCDICNKRFHRQDIFEKHCLGHSGVKPYECKECGKRFIYKSNLRQHMIIHKQKRQHMIIHKQKRQHMIIHKQKRQHMIIHKQKKLKSSFMCEVCMKKFCSSYSLKRHAKIHNRDKSHICNICQKVFANAKGLKCHRDIYKGKQAYGCSECEKIFHLRKGLNKHLLVHKKEYFQCDKCPRKFLNQKSLHAHKNLICGKKSSANICDTFSDESNQSKTINPSITDLEGLHVINNKDNNICNVCQKSFANSRLFKYHLDTYKGRQTYECTKCVKKFHRRLSLTKHLLIHNTESSKQHIDVYRGKKSNNNGDTFSDESSLNECTDLEHQSEIHKEDNNICSICKMSFANSRLFKYHLDTYKGRQTYECPECVKKFHHRVSLNKHLIIHKKVSFQCDVCHKTFADPVTLQQHIHVLSGDKSYECNIEDMFSGESIKNLINKRLSLNKEFNPCTTEKPCVIYIRKEIQE